MTEKQPPRARKRPKQSRSLFTVHAIQQACLKILDEEGADKLTTQRIADVAGVNIASLYQYFPSKEAILADVYDKAISELAEQTSNRFQELNALSNQSLSNTLATIIDLECEQLLALLKLDPNFFREYQHSFDIHRRVDELTQSQNNPSWQAWLEPWLVSHHCKGSPRFRGHLIEQTLQGNLRYALLEQPALLADLDFRQELLQLLLAYLS
jgi:AcrR family transcriptional regulator